MIRPPFVVSGAAPEIVLLLEGSGFVESQCEDTFICIWFGHIFFTKSNFQQKLTFWKCRLDCIEIVLEGNRYTRFRFENTAICIWI